ISEIKKLKFSVGLRAVYFTSYSNKTTYIYQNEILSLDNIKDSIDGKIGDPLRKKLNFEPRISFNYILSEDQSIKAGISRNNQYLTMMSNSLAPTPIDFWNVADYHFKPISGTNYFLGYFKNFSNSMWETSLEIYYTSLSNVQEYKDFASLLVNEHLETEIVFGKGKNYGAEFSINKNTGTITGKLNYTYSRALRKIDFVSQKAIGPKGWYPSIADKPHDINMFINFNLSQRISFNFNFNYSSGRPITVPINRYVDWNAGSILFFGERNSYRIPDYHRLDFALVIQQGYKADRKVKTNWNFSVLNLYGRKNAYSVFFEQRPFERLKTYKYSILGTILPSISVTTEF
ncbi:MAG: hypothetical protein RLZZ546_1314, partial [Bacteroidota bacterium]